jgi:hypothetical protein
MKVELFPQEFKKYIKQSRNSYPSGFGYSVLTKSGYVVFDFHDSPHKKCSMKLKRQSGNGAVNFIHANNTRTHSILTRNEFVVDFDISQAKTIEVRRTPVSTRDISICSIVLSDEIDVDTNSLRKPIIKFSPAKGTKENPIVSRYKDQVPIYAMDVVCNNDAKNPSIVSNFKFFSYGGHRNIGTYDGVRWYQYNRYLNVENFCICDIDDFFARKNMYVYFDPDKEVILDETKINIFKICDNLFVCSEEVVKKLSEVGIKSSVLPLMIPYVAPSNVADLIVPKEPQKEQKEQKEYILVFGGNEDILNDIKNLGYRCVVFERGSSNEDITMVSEYIELPDLISLIQNSSFVLDFVFDYPDKPSPWLDLALGMGKSIVSNSLVYKDSKNYCADKRVLKLQKEDISPNIENYMQKYKDFSKIFV